jgi:outer membrane protein assembly factor BamA
VEVPHKKYYYDRVQIFLDYDPLKFTETNGYPKKDSIQTDGYTIFYQGKHPSLRLKTLLDNCFINPHGLYSVKKEEDTYSAFSTLNALSNLHIQFDEKQRNDSVLLDCFILTLPTRKESVSFSVEGTHTAGDLGVASSIHYTHRNLFRGAESFNLRVRGAYEAVSNFSNPYLELGGEASVRIPKFIFPFVDNFNRSIQMATEFSLTYNYQTRHEYDRTLLSGGIRYNWQKRGRLSAQHQLEPIGIDYVYLPRTDTLFMNSLPRSAQYFGYTNQFIVGSRYSFYHSTFDPLQKQKNAHLFRFSVESAGNALYALGSALHWKKDNEGIYQLFGTHFAQFVKADFDYSKTIILDKQNSFAWRIGGGIGYPYGNAQMLPFEKRYYSGGANSVRAWMVRELGPGRYVPNSKTNFFHQSGDIKLDMNIEYRTRFFWKLEAAAFVDAGNIWTIRNYAEQEGGKFKIDSFYKEIAVGYGAGLRLDFDFFLVRFDCGWKVYDPARSGVDAWAVLHPNFTNNWAWHIAVGYPF